MLPLVVNPGSREIRGLESRLSREIESQSQIAANVRYMCRIAAGSQMTRLSRKAESDRTWIAARIAGTKRSINDFPEFRIAVGSHEARRIAAQPGRLSRRIAGSRDLGTSNMLPFAGVAPVLTGNGIARCPKSGTNETATVCLPSQTTVKGTSDIR